MWRWKYFGLDTCSSKWSPQLPDYGRLSKFRKIYRAAKTTAVSIMKLNYGEDIFFQEDNSPVRKSRKVINFLKSFQLNVLDWPAKSPDLDIAEDVWKLLFNSVYFSPPFKNKAFSASKNQGKHRGY